LIEKLKEDTLKLKQLCRTMKEQSEDLSNNQQVEKENEDVV
jgi:hypothetical protein